MQTKRQIQELLNSAGFSLNKRRGQNFLIDLNLMRLLVDSADIYNNDIVLEVGCGTGSLTQALAERAGKVIAVEIEQTLAEIAKKELADYDNIEFIVSDTLEAKRTIDHKVIESLSLAKSEYAGRILLVSNLPYSVASPVMINLVTGRLTADGMCVTIQKEVAQRMTAAPDTEHYGILSILLAATGELKLIRTLKPDVFWPAPQVESAMITFTRNKAKVDLIQNMQILTELVELFMQHRRKMLKACIKFATGSLAGIKNWSEIFERCSIDPHSRPEQISPDSFVSIANLLIDYC